MNQDTEFFIRIFVNFRDINKIFAYKCLSLKPRISVTSCLVTAPLLPVSNQYCRYCITRHSTIYDYNPG